MVFKPRASYVNRSCLVHACRIRVMTSDVALRSARATAPLRATRPIDATTNQKFFPFRDRTPVAAPMWITLVILVLTDVAKLLRRYFSAFAALPPDGPSRMRCIACRKGKRASRWRMEFSRPLRRRRFWQSVPVRVRLLRESDSERWMVLQLKKTGRPR